MAKGDDNAKADNLKLQNTCFVMMPISDADGYPEGHFNEVYSELIQPAVTEAGYECVLATSTSSAHMIQLEVVTKIATAPLCICDLSTNNPNVLFEYGLRQAFDLPTVLIKDDKTRRIFDLSGFRDIEYDHTLRIASILASRKSIVNAIKDTVAGSTDGEQVFSLVKLMNLAKAALPRGDVDPKDARFELLERKLDDIAERIQLSRSPTADVDWKSGILTSGSKGSVFAYPSGLDSFLFKDGELLLRENGRATRIRNMSTLRRTAAFQALTPKAQASLLANINAKASKFDDERS